MEKSKHFLCLLFSLILFLQCEKKEDLSYPFVEYESKGSLTASVNGKSWEVYKPSSRFSTLVTFSNKYSAKDCNNDSLYHIAISSLFQKIHNDFLFGYIVDVKGGKMYNKFRSYHDSNNDTFNFCEQGETILSFSEGDGTIARYAVDTNYTNNLKIDHVTNEKIEGSFDIKFIESRVFRGLVNPWTDVPDTLHFVCDKFTALRDTIF